MCFENRLLRILRTFWFVQSVEMECVSSLQGDIIFQFNITYEKESKKREKVIQFLLKTSLDFIS